MTPEELYETLLDGGYRYYPKTGYWKRNGERLGSLNAKGYRLITVAGKKYLAHRLAFIWMEQRWPDGEVDHDDRKRDNNKWANLIECTHQQNCWNFGARNKTKIRGVTWDKARNKYRVQVMRHGKSYSIGHFADLELAALVAEEARAILYAKD